MCMHDEFVADYLYLQISPPLSGHVRVLPLSGHPYSLGRTRATWTGGEATIYFDIINPLAGITHISV